jgi:hypothetical protein
MRLNPIAATAISLWSHGNPFVQAQNNEEGRISAEVPLRRDLSHSGPRAPHLTQHGRDPPSWLWDALSMSLKFNIAQKTGDSHRRLQEIWA